MKKNIIIVLALLIFAIFISGCMDILITPEEDLLGPEDDSIDPGTGKGRLKIYLTDAPGDYLEVNITISRIEAHIAGDDEGTEGYWVVLKEWLSDEEPTFDLIKLQNVSELLVDEFFDVGKYTQLRLFVTQASILVEIEETGEDSKLTEVTDEVPSDTIDVEIPSVYQTLLKLWMAKKLF